MKSRTFHIITADYPPTQGGVADYSAELARALIGEGCDVNVYCRGEAVESIREPDGVVVFRVAGRFGRIGLSRLSRELDRARAPRTILVQYTPHAYGFRAMNIWFTAWVASRAQRGDEVRIMFHEVSYPWVRHPLRHNLIALANRLMAAILLLFCSRAYVSIPAWAKILRRLGTNQVPITWTPVPSNIPYISNLLLNTHNIIELDAQHRSLTQPIVGHFGTYGSLITPILEPVIRELLDRRPDVMLLLLGAGGDRWRVALLENRPDWSCRIIAPGEQPGSVLRDGLKSCQCLIQPYPDGVSSRRGTMMASLANGRPVITNLGKSSEGIWSTGAVALTSFDIPRLAVDLTCEVLDSIERRAELSKAARQFYEDFFSIAHTVRTLLQSGESRNDPQSP